MDFSLPSHEGEEKSLREGLPASLNRASRLCTTRCALAAYQLSPFIAIDVGLPYLLSWINA